MAPPEEEPVAAATGSTKLVNALTPGGEWHVNANPLTTGGSAPRASNAPTRVTAVGGNVTQTVPNVLPESQFAPGGGQGPAQIGMPTLTGPAPVGRTSVGGVPQISGVQIAQAQGVQAPQMGQLQQAHTALAEAERAAAAKGDWAGQAELRQRQMALMDEFERVIAGRNGPSVAELMLQQASDQAARQQMGVAAARSGGGNYGLAMREAGMNMADIQAQANQSGALLRAKEITDARAGLGALQDFARKSDISVASKQGDWENTINSLNAQLGTDVSRTNATNLTETSRFNAGEGNKREYQQAGLNLDADKFNAGEANETNRAQAEITSRIGIAQAGLELQSLLKQAELDQARGIFNADLAAKIAIAQADLKLRVDSFNAGWTNQVAAREDAQQFGAGEAEKDRALDRAKIAAGVLTQPSQPSGGGWKEALGAGAGALVGAGGFLIPGAGPIIGPITTAAGAKIGADLASGGGESEEERRKRQEDELRRLGLL